MTVAGQTPVTYSYDNANCLTQGTNIVSYTYDSANRRTQMDGTLARANLSQDMTASYDTNPQPNSL